VVIAIQHLDAIPDQVAIFVSRTVEEWQRGNPDTRVTTALPIVDDGKTIAVHLWYDGRTGSRE
jgi:hypothetical protein